MHQHLLQGARQASRLWQATAASERGQSQPPYRGVRRTGESVFWWHHHRRGTQSRPRVIWQLRTELWAPPFSRSRALGRMLPGSAQALWPFFCVSARLPARPLRRVLRWSPRTVGFAVAVASVTDDPLFYTTFSRAALLPAGAWLCGLTPIEPWPWMPAS